MNKIYFLIMPILIVSSLARAAETEAPEGAGSEALGWTAHLKKAAIQISSTEISNAKEYRNSPNSELSGDSETVTKGVFDFSLTQEKSDYKWENSLFAEYGKTKLKPVDGPNVTNETADKILLTTDYSRKMWEYWGAYVGPFVNLGYQTEFEANDDAPRTKIIRGMSGLKMFDGKYIKNLYGALVGEYDFTYSGEKTTKGAYEIGIEAEYPLREGIVFHADSYWRDYFAYSSYNPTDFEYELSAKANMMVDIYEGLQIGPFIQYFRAEDRGSSKAGSSTIIGIEGAYGGSWEL